MEKKFVIEVHKKELAGKIERAYKKYMDSVVGNIEKALPSPLRRLYKKSSMIQAYVSTMIPTVSMRRYDAQHYLKYVFVFRLEESMIKGPVMKMMFIGIYQGLENYIYKELDKKERRHVLVIENNGKKKIGEKNGGKERRNHS